MNVVARKHLWLTNTTVLSGSLIGAISAVLIGNSISSVTGFIVAAIVLFLGYRGSEALAGILWRPVCPRCHCSCRVTTEGRVRYRCSHCDYGMRTNWWSGYDLPP